jgi:serine/threonine-protein kinase RsbW
MMANGATEMEDLVDFVAVTIPARAAMWGLPRFAVSTVATQLDFDVEQVEDVRIAVGELCTLCAAGATRRSQLKLSVEWDNQSLKVSCEALQVRDLPVDDGDLPPGFLRGELSYRILEAIVDDYGVSSTENGARLGWFHKSR